MEPDRSADLQRAMSSIVGADHVLVDADQRVGYETDWTGRYRGRCTAVVRPASTAEVARVLAHCNAHGIAVVTQAGNSGLVGGSVPRATRAGAGPDPTIVLSTRRLDTITDIDTTSLQLTAGAGVTIADWQRSARGVGLDTPVDFAARDSATIGGAISTDAGGSRVVRFGTMRRQVVGIEAVLADGTVVGSLAGLPKETVGLHWPSVLTGSEGTLAVITAARLRLIPRFDQVATVFVSLQDVATAVAVLERLRGRLACLDSIEIMWPEAIGLVAEHLGRPAPVEVRADGVALLVECADHVDPTELLLTELGTCDGVVATAVAADGPRRQHLLSFRDRITEAIGAAATATGSPTYKLDVAVPTRSLDRVVDTARRAADRQRSRLIAFGHLAEGNLHLNFLDTTDPEHIAETVLSDVVAAGGTISAEHGVGIAKTRWLHLVRSSGDLAAQRAIKRALDPNGILNPGVLEPPP